MAANDPKPDDKDDFRRQITSHDTRAAAPEQESAWDRIASTLSGVADRSTGWAAARVKDTFSEFVDRFIYGHTGGSPEPSDKHLAHAQEIEQTREPEKGVDR